MGKSIQQRETEAVSWARTQFDIYYRIVGDILIPKWYPTISPKESFIIEEIVYTMNSLGMDRVPVDEIVSRVLSFRKVFQTRAQVNDTIEGLINKKIVCPYIYPFMATDFRPITRYPNVELELQRKFGDEAMRKVQEGINHYWNQLQASGVKIMVIR